MRTPWLQFFEPASWSGGAWGEGDLAIGDLTPERLVLNLVRNAYASDVVLIKIFGDERIEMMDIRDPFRFDSRDLPRLQVYLGSLEEELQATKLERRELSVFTGLRYDATLAFAPLAPGEPGPDSVIERCKRILQANRELPVSVGGNSVATVHNAQQASGISYLLDVDESGQRRAVTIVLEWRYRVEVDTDTGKITNIQAAGG